MRGAGPAGVAATAAGEGWVRRFVAAPPRLEEVVKQYEDMGFEVRLDPLPASDLAPECGGCALALAFFRVIYTRSPA